MMPGDDVLTEPVARRLEIFTGADRRHGLGDQDARAGRLPLAEGAG